MKSLSRKNYVKYVPYQPARRSVSIDWSPVICVLIFVAVIVLPLIVGR